MRDITFNLTKKDIGLVSDDENMIGACKRRLDCYLNSPYIYSDYGSELETLIGLRKSDVNLSLIEQETVNTLLQDTRISDVDADASYTVNGIRVEVNLTYNDNQDLEFTYNTDEEL